MRENEISSFRIMKYSLTFFLFFFVITQFLGCNTDDIKDAIEEEFVDFAEPLDETTSKPSDPARVLPPNPTGCPNWEKNILNRVTESLTLPEGCKYDRVRILIENESDLTLDCNGAELNGLDKEFRQAVGVPYSASDAPSDIGIRILSLETIPSGNVTVKNCVITNFLTGISVQTVFIDETIADLKNNINAEVVEDHLRNSSLKNVRLENNIINYSHRNGLFINRYITGLVVDNTTIKYTSGAGLYLESGSQSNIIQNSVISENGHSIYDSGERVRKRILEKDAREGIAIDSSAMNTIQNNTFAKNSGGGIFLYKNCYEYHTSPTSLPRYQSANNNVITGNKFEDQRVGVWIASRQSKDLEAFNCGIPKIATDTVRYGPVEEDIFIYEDFAKFNNVNSNTFIDVIKGIIVEDDNNTINGNKFSGDVDYDVQIGTKYRTEALSKPVTDTKITNNEFNSSASEHVRVIYDSVNTVITGNIPATVNN
ncbi:right-handed parallel beta-helix repeat-containing protein [uncultured Cocleimonas sp.]|uniref:right-handed parallel beta-helix repeat-containing protein n=1 Tax=uncultured Cocleimonas sp. TaxID=1051587 RepID=UPI00261E1EAB|nr:right-handed parallel beta-helix repeat-containing protein [uncultured Cocleimonas sp.]